MPAVLFVLSSHATLGSTGKQTGWYLPEAAHPHAVLERDGFAVAFASPAGGAPPMVGEDPSDPVQRRFLTSGPIRDALRQTTPLRDVDADAYDAVLMVGGHGTMWDFPADPALARIAASIYDRGGAVAAVCHGPAGLLDIKHGDGSHLVSGRRVAAFSNAEEDAVGLSTVVPFLLQDALAERGAIQRTAEPFQPHVEVDGRLITGQNPASAAAMAEELATVLRAGTAVARR
jgi:putative intracellular protease/amidase